MDFTAPFRTPKDTVQDSYKSLDLKSGISVVRKQRFKAPAFLLQSACSTTQHDLSL